MAEAIRTPLRSGRAHLVAVVSATAGTGKTTTTAALGAVLASERDDRVVAVDLGGGELPACTAAHRIDARVRDLTAGLVDDGFDVLRFTLRTPWGLEVLDTDALITPPGRPLDAAAYSSVLTVLSPYAIVLTDCATGVEGLATFVALTKADQRIFVSDLSEAGVAATRDALAAYGYLADRSHVVLTGTRGSGPMLSVREAVERLREACRSVVVVPFDGRLADGAGEGLASMRDGTREAYRVLAAAVVEGFNRTRTWTPDPGAGMPGGIQGRPPQPQSHYGGPQTEAARPAMDMGGGRPGDGYESYGVQDPYGHDDTAASPRPSPAPEDVRARLTALQQGTASARGAAGSTWGRGAAVRPAGYDRAEFPASGGSDTSPATPIEPTYPAVPPGATGTSSPTPATPSYGGQQQMGPAMAGPTQPDRPQTTAPTWGSPTGQDHEPDAYGQASFNGSAGAYYSLQSYGDGTGPDRGDVGRPGPPTSFGFGRHNAGSPQPGPERRGTTGAGAEDEGTSRTAGGLGGRQSGRRDSPATGGVTASGLPRRVPRTELIPGDAAPGPGVSRAPEDVRGRLDNLRRRVEQRRQAGTGPNEQDPGTDDHALGGASPAPGGIGSPSRRLLGRGALVGDHLGSSYSGSSQGGSSQGGLSQGGALLSGGPAPAPALSAPWIRAEPAPVPPADGIDPLAEPHHLIAELAEQAAPNREVPLHVQIARRPGQDGAGVLMRPFPLPEKGARLTITVTAPGLHAPGDLQQQLVVYPGRDSDVLYFGLRTLHPGLHQVIVRAFHHGTYLGAVHCQISVTEGGVTRDGPRRRALLPGIAFAPGEVTLQVHRNIEDGSLSFQLLSETCYPPEQFRFRGGDPRQAAEQIYAQLREAAGRAGPGSRADTAGLRGRLKNQGVQLWKSTVPEAVQRQFWEQADHITSFTVLGEHDFVPWELLYPLEPHRDNGFLAEWLPVVRRVFRQDRVHRLELPGAAFVMPPGSPPDAELEITVLRKWLGPGVANAGVLTERAALTSLIERGHAGLLHFACHNAFSGSGSRVHMADGPFDPIDLATAAQTRSLRAHHPLVFFNACRSAGEIDWFGSSLGWAPQFLEAGAGAFIGTLWPVRSYSAMQFAKAFYDHLLEGGQSLGQASLAARQAIRDQHGDPTWLAYAVYGSPTATATRSTTTDAR
ncbi:CHAT domain-containing protein [Streptomyces sp. NPDC002265]|uniref:CHAT domain-containing protein n=1 Tax=Streptomyces sp. NPDC002265 TaxID=3154415 RepID=UPI00332A5F36